MKLIKEDIENELYSYLGGILKYYKSNPLQIGRTSDLMKTDISDDFFSPATGLNIIVVVQTPGVARRYYI